MNFKNSLEHELKNILYLSARKTFNRKTQGLICRIGYFRISKLYITSFSMAGGLADYGASTYFGGFQVEKLNSLFKWPDSEIVAGVFLRNKYSKEKQIDFTYLKKRGLVVASTNNLFFNQFKKYYETEITLRDILKQENIQLKLCETNSIETFFQHL